jgi:signal transduction histidine kinase
MRFRTWPVVAIALTGLLLLIVFSVVATRRKSQAIYTQFEQLNRHHREVETLLRRLRADVQVSGIFVRDYLLDTSRQNAPEYRERLTELRQNTLSTIGDLERVVGQGEAVRIASLKAKLADYWEGFEPLFGWTVAQKFAESPAFLRKEVLPRRDAVLAITQEIEALNNENMNAQRDQVAQRERELRDYLNRVLWQSVTLGVVVAVLAVIRLRVLERRSEEQRRRTERAENEMRRLSNKLVRTQEEERSNLSRELHDHVGQMLTALRMELGRAERTRSALGTNFADAIAECKHLSERMMRTVRDLSLGLRPSMLDDFGLRPAIEWHVRDFSRRCGVPVDVEVAGEFDDLQDPHRTCIYRVVQEALTNCARHAHASHIRVALRADASSVEVTVADDGVGFVPAARGPGIGLIGLDERVRDIGGALVVDSAADRGTTLRVRIPTPAPVEEEPLAHTAG